MNIMWMLLHGLIHMPRPGANDLRNIRPTPRPNIVPGISSDSASILPVRSCTAFRPVMAIR